MDFELSSDQEALVEGIADFCAGRFSIETIRGLADQGGVDPARWQELVDMGVIGLVTPESANGIGLGWADAVLVFEQLGRHVLPGPILTSMLAAPWVPEVLDGSARVAIIERPGSGSAMVEYLDVVDTLLVLDEAGIHRIAASEVDGLTQPVPLDPLTPVSIVADLPPGERVADANAAAQVRTQGALLTAALQLGLAAGATDLAVSYAKDRQQFGKPIGQFQAVKHLCAEMITQVELARAAVYSAGVMMDTPEVGDPVEAASVAAIVAAHAGDFCGKNGIQVHGGMGYTWEVDAHLFLKRSWVLDHAFGSADDHADLLAERLGNRP